MTGPNWELSDDCTHITVTFPTDPPVALKLDAQAVDEHLANMGEMRAHMLPEHAPDWALGQKVGVIPNPRWVTEPEMLEGNSLVHVRDPRFGWLHYLIPRDAARKLSDYLRVQADQPPEQTPERTN